MRPRDSGVHGSSAIQPLSVRSRRRAVPDRASTLASWADSTPLRGIRQIGEQPRRERIVPIDDRSHPHPDQARILHEADGHELPVTTPHPNGAGQVLRAQPPVPPQVARMKLNRRSFLLPGRQRRGDLVE